MTLDRRAPLPTPPTLPLPLALCRPHPGPIAVREARGAAPARELVRRAHPRLPPPVHPPQEPHARQELPRRCASHLDTECKSPGEEGSLERYLLNTRRVDVMDIHAHCLKFHGASTETCLHITLPPALSRPQHPSVSHPLTFSFPVHTGALPEGLTSVLPLVTTPRSGADLPCQILPQRTYEEVQQLYGASLFYI